MDPFLRSVYMRAKRSASLREAVRKMLARAEIKDREARAYPIESIHKWLSVRAKNGLKNAGIKTVGDLVVITPRQLMCTRNFGKKSLQETQEALWHIGMDLGMEPLEGDQEIAEITDSDNLKRLKNMPK
jgi:DNA-directed RNA polymerase alpha subunit